MTKVAYTFEGEEYSYEHLIATSDAIATWLYNNYGDKNLRVCVNMEKNTFFIPAILAILKMGYTYVPIDPSIPQQRIKFIKEDAEVDVVLTEESVRDILNEDNAASVESRNVAPTDIAYIIYTSGTSGKPKGVPITYHCLYCMLDALSSWENVHITHESVILQFASINFDPSVLEIYATFFYAATLVIPTHEERIDTDRLKILMKKHNVTYASIPPSLLSVISWLDFPTLETLCSGGEAMPKSLAKRIVGNSSYRFVNVYGPTENTVQSTMRIMRTVEDCHNIGTPMKGVIAYVLNDEGKLAEVGEEGELLLGGEQLMSGYLNNSKLTNEVIIPNPCEETSKQYPQLYRTGDIVKLCEDGSFDFVGRRDSQVKVNGYRIELGEINAVIEGVEGVKQAYTQVESIGINKVLVSYLIKEENSEITLDAIRKHVAEHLPEYMIPAFWNFVDEFKLNVNGKIDTASLHNKSLDDKFIKNEKLNVRERFIMQQVADILELKSVSIDADMVTELGLSSIQMMYIVSELAIADIVITVDDIMRERTIRQLAGSLKEKKLGYWFNDDDNTTKPVLVVICGYGVFNITFDVWVTYLQDKFSIYVIEQYHAIIGTDRMLTLDQLTDIYIELLAPVAAKHHIAGITGPCIGGEHALYVAHRMYKDSAEKPPVLIMDGEVDRELDRKKTSSFYLNCFTPEENAHRIDQDFLLMSSTPDFKYEGRVVSFVSKNFIDYFSAFDPAPTQYKVECMLEAFNTAAQRWRNRYPDAEIYVIDTNHIAFWHDENSLEIMAKCYLALE